MRAFFTVFIVAAVVLAAAVFADIKGLVDLPMEKLPIIGSFVEKRSGDGDVDTPDSELTASPDSTDSTTSPNDTDDDPAPDKAESPAVAAQADDEDDEAARLHPMPKFKSIDEIMQGWTQLPPTAFPRECTLTKPAERQVKNAAGEVIGSSSIPVGTKLQALRSEGSNIHLAATVDSAATTVVPLDHTDLQATFTGLYDDFQEKLRSSILSKRAAERSRIAAETGVSPSSGGASSAITRPVAVAVSSSVPRDDARFAPMIESLEGGRYKEIKLESVTGWNWAGPQTVEGKDYDVGIVSFKVMTMFGALDTEAMALISNGKVSRWLYTGSMEQVY